MPGRLSYTGQRVTIMGLGTFGGGLGAVQFLLEQGAIVTLTDLRTESELHSSFSQIDVSKLDAVLLGEHRESDFQNADLIVVNPAVKPENRFVALATAHGVPLTSEIELFWERNRAKSIVVTGTVGKSTTTTLIHHLLQAAGEHALVGGNLGQSLLPMVGQLTQTETVVLELSSFQLSALDRIRCAPDIAVVTNFSPNHLDWHGTIEHYSQSKQVVLKYQTSDQFSVLNLDCPASSKWVTKGTPLWFGRQARGENSVQICEDHFLISGAKTQSLGFSELAPCLQFPHQHQNVAAAIAVLCLARQIPLDMLRPAFASYVGLSHRFEIVPTTCGRRIINDSKATTPEATIAALRSLTGPGSLTGPVDTSVHGHQANEPRPVVLVAGGKDKQVDLTLLCEEIAHRTTAVAFIGDTATTLQAQTVKVNPELLTKVFDDFEQALAWATEQTAPGATLLLSPGCASHSEFLNYEDRGDQFRRYFRR